jgi:hypothetical protein
VPTTKEISVDTVRVIGRSLIVFLIVAALLVPLAALSANARETVATWFLFTLPTTALYGLAFAALAARRPDLTDRQVVFLGTWLVLVAVVAAVVALIAPFVEWSMVTPDNRIIDPKPLLVALVAANLVLSGVVAVPRIPGALATIAALVTPFTLAAWVGMAAPWAISAQYSALLDGRFGLGGLVVIVLIPVACAITSLIRGLLYAFVPLRALVREH